MPKRESSEAQRRAVKKHDMEKVDRINVRLPKGTKDKIYSLGYSANAYVIEAVNEKLEKDYAKSNGKEELKRDPFEEAP